MDTLAVVAIVVVVLLALAAAALLLQRQRQSKQLRDRFGSEYDRTVEQSDDRRAAERELRERAERREQLQIRPLDDRTRDEYAAEWRRVQETFVDAPAQAVKQADLLVARVMQERGYPVGDFEQQARDVSVDHGAVVEQYRSAHEISLLNDREAASTEQQRQAMVHYRALFSDLLDEDGAERGDGHRSSA
jgi:hypothetical protein